MLSKKQKEKYRKEIALDEELIHLAIKLVTSAAVLFIGAIGMDVYHLIR